MAQLKWLISVDMRAPKASKGSIAWQQGYRTVEMPTGATAVCRLRPEDTITTSHQALINDGRPFIFFRPLLCCASLAREWFHDSFHIIPDLITGALAVLV